jgi:hypothetical protein
VAEWPLKGKKMGALPVWLQAPNSLIPSRLKFSDLWQRFTPPQNGIDLGNGRTLGAEDVLEGHYRRISSRRQAYADRPATRQVAVQVGDNLMVAIAVLAPDLVPLTEVAEQVSDAVPLVAPERHFRENLHEALERTHRQHAAQRVLGTRPLPRAKSSNGLNWWVVLAGLLATIALVLGWRWRQASSHAA